MLVYLTYEFLTWAPIKKWVAAQKRVRQPGGRMEVYPILFILGGGLVCFYWWGANKYVPGRDTQGVDDSPVFAPQSAGIVATKTDDGKPAYWNVAFSFTQTGRRSAINNTYTLLITGQDLDRNPTFYGTKSDSNETVLGEPLVLSLPVNIKTPMPPQFVFLRLEYGDKITNKRKVQEWYLVWSGVSKEGVTTTTFSKASAEQRARIQAYFSQHKVPCSSDKDAPQTR